MMKNLTALPGESEFLEMLQTLGFEVNCIVDKRGMKQFYGHSKNLRIKGGFGGNEYSFLVSPAVVEDWFDLKSVVLYLKVGNVIYRGKFRLMNLDLGDYARLLRKYHALIAELLADSSGRQNLRKAIRVGLEMFAEELKTLARRAKSKGPSGRLRN